MVPVIALTSQLLRALLQLYIYICVLYQLLSIGPLRTQNILRPSPQQYIEKVKRRQNGVQFLHSRARSAVQVVSVRSTPYSDSMQKQKVSSNSVYQVSWEQKVALSFHVTDYCLTLKTTEAN